HAQVFAKSACRQPNDFVRIGDLRQLEVELVYELCVEFGLLGFGDVFDVSQKVDGSAMSVGHNRAIKIYPNRVAVFMDIALFQAEGFDGAIDQLLSLTP